VAGGNFETARIKLGAYVLGVVQVEANGFDMAEHGLLSDVQYTVELTQRAERIQLDGEYVDIAHWTIMVWGLIRIAV
jgi:hypothetical protein